ncbi:MAG: hypothetical protein ACI81O_002726 [Cyclobacteriaceae bacterium]|jgi:hypothetical protein
MRWREHIYIKVIVATHELILGPGYQHGYSGCLARQLVYHAPRSTHQFIYALSCSLYYID